jgi:hypothetical protein
MNTMSYATTGFDQIEEDILTYEVSDESLEMAAGKGNEKAGNFTLGACTGFLSCPSQ